MPTNPKHSPSSEPISRDKPIHQDGQSAVDTFDPDEFLYRRYSVVHFVDGHVLPQAISFPKPSFNRSRFSRPEDALHIDCCGGKQLSPGWGVLESRAANLRVSAELGDRRRFTMYPKHVPLPTCYAHSELWCASPLDSEDAKPSSSAKEKLRILLSRALTARIVATA
jgi:hypothetical protein